MPCALAENATLPVPTAENVHWKVVEAPPANATDAGTEPVKRAEPVPNTGTRSEGLGSTDEADACPEFVTVIVTLKVCPTFTEAGSPLNCAIKLTGDCIWHDDVLL
ncbi:MAG: hypothetical protein BWY65_02353 [Firmicutes bacterium ADurb.Bin373]|nr:MAG: hypothetical protein BWY65_02353 [Firmicutes bacterium ADurb.Bin373]